MQQVISITSQGQINIPRVFRDSLGINGHVKAVIRKTERGFSIEPKVDFWSLGGFLSSDIKLSDEELKKARDSFSKTWSNEK